MHFNITKIISHTFFFSILFITACKGKYRRAADEIADNLPRPINMNIGVENYVLDFCLFG